MACRVEESRSISNFTCGTRRAISAFLSLQAAMLYAADIERLSLLSSPARWRPGRTLTATLERRETGFAATPKAEDLARTNAIFPEQRETNSERTRIATWSLSLRSWPRRTDGRIVDAILTVLL